MLDAALLQCPAVPCHGRLKPAQGGPHAGEITLNKVQKHTIHAYNRIKVRNKRMEKEREPRATDDHHQSGQGVRKGKIASLTDLQLALNASFAALPVVYLTRVVIVHNFDKFT